mgnify:CR=1 FL=1
MTALRVFFFFIISIFFSCHSTSKKEILRIATASNAKYALIDIANSYKQKHNIEIEVISASSGKLTAQIKQAAPYDIFVSADIKFPMSLYNTAYCKQQPKTYAYGQLVLWSMHDSLINETNLCDKTLDNFAIANPISSPYGQASIEVLNHYNCQTGSAKMLMGENINKTSQLIRESAVSFGFSAASIVHNKINKGMGHWKLVPKNSYQPIAQSAVVLSRTQHSHSDNFFNYLFSPEAQKILRNYGYRIPK